MFAVNTFHLIQTLKKERKKRNIKHVDLLVYTWEPFNASGQIYMPLASAFSLRICGPTNPSDTKKKGGRLTHPHPCGMCSSICYKNDWIHI